MALFSRAPTVLFYGARTRQATALSLRDSERSSDRAGAWPRGMSPPGGSNPSLWLVNLGMRPSRNERIYVTLLQTTIDEQRTSIHLLMRLFPPMRAFACHASAHRSSPSMSLSLPLTLISFLRIALETRMNKTARHTTERKVKRGFLAHDHASRHPRKTVRGDRGEREKKIYQTQFDKLHIN